MITYTITQGDIAQKGQPVNLSFYGKSTDEKPTYEYDGLLIANGSSFLEMDTKNVSFYDVEAKGWV